jgi:acyl transferase domain-containing protein
MDHHNHIRSSDVAIIGLSCRFPGANDVETFWQNLRNGVESIRQFSEDELEQPDLTLRRDPRFVRAGAVLPNIDYFDADFFGYSAKEAALIDPQQRIFLECAWEALERAGYPPETHTKRIGVYAGASISNYLINHVIGGQPAVFMGTNLDEFQALLANDRNFLASRVSYKLNLAGPTSMYRAPAQPAW